MEYPERLDRCAVSHDRPDHSVATILALAKTIPVFDSRIPAGDGAVPRSDNVVHTDIIAQNFTAPAIMVSRDPDNLESCVSELCEGRECAKAAAGNHRLPFEPEVEQVAVDDERSRFTIEIAQKTNERAFNLRTRNAKVRVGYDVRWACEHGSN
jgi:hypothetical protein